MNYNNYKTVVRLFLSSTNWILRFAFLALPISLILALTSYLFIDNLLKSYNTYLVDAYVGLHGRLTIESTDKRLITELSLWSDEQQILYSKRDVIPCNLTFVGKKTMLKYARVIVLDKSYLQVKFKDVGSIDAYTLFANQVFTKSLGHKKTEQFDVLFFEDEEHSAPISHLHAIDTGFLTDKPTIFMSKEMADKLFEIRLMRGEQLEFLINDDNQIKKIIHAKDLIAKELGSMEVRVHDLLHETKDSRNFFSKISLVHTGISALILLLSFGIIATSTSITIAFKRRALDTLHLLGISKHELAMIVSSLVFGVFAVSLVFSLLLLPLMQIWFSSVTEYNNNFFIPIEMMPVAMISVFATIAAGSIYLLVKRFYV